ncbi:MAG: 2-C-methyl-D-erythritol 4-phosphate cytidylyltransferase [Gemmatimonadaceae bacterium]|nr:2-C-methyl-D-erythritol 4-phosphate cytidylyltransferase [Gemmatimonadaceae bacterium]
MSAPDVGVVIVAAGSSTRIGGGELKQFTWVAGKPMLLHSLQRFQERPDVAMVVCVVPRQYAGDPPPWIFQSDGERLLLSVGGRTRAESVRNGLAELPDSCRIVLVHDAARPLVPMEVIDRVVDAVRAGTSAIAALPVVDTLKAVDEEGRILRTVPRESLWRAQTPQGFPRALLLRAHRAAMDGGYDATDDGALVELLGEPVVVVRGSERAMKVTEAADFARAEALRDLAD